VLIDDMRVRELLVVPVMVIVLAAVIMSRLPVNRRILL
jgi:hypothetical protein